MPFTEKCLECKESQEIRRKMWLETSSDAIDELQGELRELCRKCLDGEDYRGRE